MNKIIHVAVVDDHLLFRQGMVALLKEFEGINVLFDVSNGKELLEKLKTTKPDVILLDLEMPIMNGREALEKIRQKLPKQKVIIISQHFQDSYIIEFIKKGVNGFLNKNSGIEKIVDALYATWEHGFYYDSTVALIMAKNLSSNSNPEPGIATMHTETGFTSREVQVIRLICLNKTNREIAEALNISVRTVEGHRLHIMHKTNSKNAVALTTYALQNNIIGIA